MLGQSTGLCCQLFSLGEQRAETGCRALCCGGESWARLPAVLHCEPSMVMRVYFLMMVISLQEPLPSLHLFVYPMWDGLDKQACRL